MANPRNCPHCKNALPVDSGYSFDEQNNLICGECGKIVFPGSSEAEGELEEKKIKTSLVTTYSNGHWNGGAYQGGRAHGHGYGAGGVGLEYDADY